MSWTYRFFLDQESGDPEDVYAILVAITPTVGRLRKLVPTARPIDRATAIALGWNPRPENAQGETWRGGFFGVARGDTDNLDRCIEICQRETMRYLDSIDPTRNAHTSGKPSPTVAEGG
jgi:hypothetical protein